MQRNHRFSIEQLPVEIHEEFKRHILDQFSIFQFSYSTKKNYDLCLLERSMQFAMRGEQKKLVDIIADNPALLIRKVPFAQDHAGREFTNISIFQFLLWALDSPLWEKLVGVVNEPSILEALYGQYIQHKKNGIKYFFNGKFITEQHFSYEPWITALADFIYQHNMQSYTHISNKTLSEYWCKNVGLAQANAVVNIINEFCREDIDFFPEPNFSNDEYPRKFNILFRLNGEDTSRKISWVGQDNESGLALGRDYAICRGNKTAVAISLPSGSEIINCQMNLNSLKKLETLRKNQFERLGIQLNPQHLAEERQLLLRA